MSLLLFFSVLSFNAHAGLGFAEVTVIDGKKEDHSPGIQKIAKKKKVVDESSSKPRVATNKKID